MLVQKMNTSGAPCPTCFFPTYPGIDRINVDAYPQADFSNQWVYFLGDVTVRQMYGEFAAWVHRAQVNHPVLSLIHLYKSRTLEFEERKEAASDGLHVHCNTCAILSLAHQADQILAHLQSSGTVLAATLSLASGL